MTDPFILWHGAQRWEGPPRLHVASGKSQEHGPGLYLTTSAETARKYARGGGSVIRFEVEPELRLLEGTKVSLARFEEFVREVPRLKARKEILADLKRYAERVGKTEIPASVLVNLMVNYRALAGEPGLALSHFLIAWGVDADLISHGSEDWLLLFNLDKIRSWKKVSAGQAVDSPRLRRKNSSPTAPSAAQGLRLGLEHGVDWDRVAFTPEQLAVGAHHELEHTQSLRTAARIALDHLRERPDYYKKLEACMPEEGKTRKRNVPVPEELKQDVWYHGTPSEAAAKGILRKGLEPGHGAGRWSQHDLSPLAGAVYLTRDESEAIRYAGGLMGKPEAGAWGYVFLFPSSALSDLVPDEDYVAAAAWAGTAVAAPEEFQFQTDDVHLQAFAQTVWAEHHEFGKKIAARVLAKYPSAWGDLEVGFRLAKWGKSTLPLLTDKEKETLLLMGAPAAHFGKPLKPTAAWRFVLTLDDDEDSSFQQEDLLEEIRGGTSLRALAAEKIL